MKAMVRFLVAAFLACTVGLGSLIARTKTDNFLEIIGENAQSLVGVTRLIVVGVPGIPELSIDNPRTGPEGKLTEGTGFIRWNKWGALRVEDVEVKEGKLELKVVAANQESEGVAAWTEDEKTKYWRDRAMRCEAALKAKGGEFNQEG
jgi:hypothetical protein